MPDHGAAPRRPPQRQNPSNIRADYSWPGQSTAEAKRRERAGKPSRITRGFRNGITVRLYHYQGTGADVLQGTYDDPWLDSDNIHPPRKRPDAHSNR